VFGTLTILKFKRGIIIFKENDVPDSAYLIKEGECEITKNIYDNRFIRDDKKIFMNLSTAKKMHQG
jgi:hypothetical protein